MASMQDEIRRLLQGVRPASPNPNLYGPAGGSFGASMPPSPFTPQPTGGAMMPSPYRSMMSGPDIIPPAYADFFQRLAGMGQPNIDPLYAYLGMTPPAAPQLGGLPGATPNRGFRPF
jgi:hypothetical protein